MPFLIDDFTFAEASQIFAEHQRARWQHTSELLSVMQAAHWDTKKHGKPPTAEQLNPWEATSPPSTKIPLDNPDGFKVLKQYAKPVSRFS